MSGRATTARQQMCLCMMKLFTCDRPWLSISAYSQLICLSCLVLSSSFAGYRIPRRARLKVLLLYISNGRTASVTAFCHLLPLVLCVVIHTRDHSAFFAGALQRRAWFEWAPLACCGLTKYPFTLQSHAAAPRLILGSGQGRSFGSPSPAYALSFGPCEDYVTLRLASVSVCGSVHGDSLYDLVQSTHFSLCSPVVLMGCSGC